MKFFCKAASLFNLIRIKGSNRYQQLSHGLLQAQWRSAGKFSTFFSHKCLFNEKTLCLSHRSCAELLFSPPAIRMLKGPTSFRLQKKQHIQIFIFITDRNKKNNRKSQVLCKLHYLLVMPYRRQFMLGCRNRNFYTHCKWSL